MNGLALYRPCRFLSTAFNCCEKSHSAQSDNNNSNKSEMNEPKYTSGSKQRTSARHGALLPTIWATICAILIWCAEILCLNKESCCGISFVVAVGCQGVTNAVYMAEWARRNSFSYFCFFWFFLYVHWPLCLPLRYICIDSGSGSNSELYCGIGIFTNGHQWIQIQSKFSRPLMILNKIDIQWINDAWVFHSRSVWQIIFLFFFLVCDLLF